MTIWIVSEFYESPTDTVGGYYVKGLAEKLASRIDVEVVFPWDKTIRTDEPGSLVKKNNIRQFSFNRKNLIIRTFAQLFMSFQFFFFLLTRVKKNDLVVSFTHPPFMIFMAVLLRYFRRIKSVVVNYDLFPEILAATGASGRGIPYKMTLNLFKWAYNKTDIIISLGEEMTENLLRKIHNPKTKISTIPNWADTENIFFSAKETNEIIQRYGLQKSTVFSYAGTIGRCQGLEMLLDLIDTLYHNEGVHFLFFGKGVAEESFKKKISENRNKHLITYAGFIFTDDPNDFLNACDIAIISLLDSMTGLNFPSKTYNIMASGHPLLFVGNKESELAKMITEHDIGWVCSFSDKSYFNKIVREAAGNPSEIKRKGENARMIALKQFSKEPILNKYLEVFVNESITDQTLG